MASQVISKLVKPPLSLYASKSNNLQALEGDLKRLAGLYKTDPKFMVSPLSSPVQKSKILETDLKNKPSDVGIEFLPVISENRRLKSLTEIENYYGQIMSAVRQKLPCLIRSSKPLDSRGKEIENSLKDFTNKKFVSEYKVHPTSVGGSKLPALSAGGAVMTWEVLPEEVKKATSTTITGAILPFSQLNFLQMIFLPYTYAVMYYMDFLLNYFPWWAAIVATTATARFVFFPVVLKLNKQGIKTNNILPATQKIQVKLNEAMLNQDAYTQALCKTKLQLLYKENGLTLKSRLLPILFQAPMYASIFFLLRALTGVPAEGLATGGALWFTDLTVPDPYYILPVITCTSMFALFEFGLEGGMNPSTGMTPVARYFLRGMPVVLFLFIQSFPAATLLFWSTSNAFTLFYALLLKNNWIKKRLNIPARIVHKPEDLPMTNMSFKGQMKNAIEKGKVTRTTLDVRRLDDIAFRKAGVGPLRKTYKEPLDRSP